MLGIITHLTPKAYGYHVKKTKSPAELAGPVASSRDAGNADERSI